MENQTIYLEKLLKIKEYAKTNDVPIVMDGGLDIIKGEINKLTSHRETPVKILEVGCAIGYCAISMALCHPSIKVDTIERNEKMYQEAIKNVQNMELEDRIHVFFSDALLIDEKLLQNDYDLIFVDAAKAQYIKFFEKFTPLLKMDGVVISDNLAFHGMAQKWREGDETMSRDLKALMRKVNRFIDWLKANDAFETIFYDEGDGVAVSKKIKEL